MSIMIGLEYGRMTRVLKKGDPMKCGIIRIAEDQQESTKENVDQMRNPFQD